MGFGIEILIIGANLYGGVYKLRILMRETMKDFLRNFFGPGHENEFGIGILIVGANLDGGVYKLIILIRERSSEAEAWHQHFSTC